MSLLLSLQHLPGETRGFLERDGRLEGLAIERAADEAAARLGDLRLGRVTRLDRRMNAAFVALAGGPDGLLPLAEAPPGLSEGAALAVRVTRIAVETKGPRLTARLAPDDKALAKGGGAPPRLLRRGAGLLEGLLAAAPDEIRCDDASLQRHLAAEGHAVRLLPAGFPAAEAARFDAELEALLRPEVALPGGGLLLLEPGRTLTAVDVNLGAATGADATLAVNLAAAAELARQLRLRALGGRIVVDFLKSDEARVRQATEEALKAALKSDPERVKPVGWSRGGLYELTRRRARPALHEVLLEPAGYGGWRKRPETLAFEALRALARAARSNPAVAPALAATPALLELLRHHPALRALEAQLGRQVELRADAGPAPFTLGPGLG